MTARELSRKLVHLRERHELMQKQERERYILDKKQTVDDYLADLIASYPWKSETIANIRRACFSSIADYEIRDEHTIAIDIIAGEVSESLTRVINSDYRRYVEEGVVTRELHKLMDTDPHWRGRHAPHRGDMEEASD